MTDQVDIERTFRDALDHVVESCSRYEVHLKDGATHVDIYAPEWDDHLLVVLRVTTVDATVTIHGCAFEE